MLCVETIRQRIDPDTGRGEIAEALRANDIGEVALALDRPIAFDPYAAHRGTGSFILLMGVLTLVGMLISDLLLALLDPRIRFT